MFLKVFIYLNLFSFPPMGKECYAENTGKPECWNAKQ